MFHNILSLNNFRFSFGTTKYLMEFVNPPNDPFANITCKWKIADNEKQYYKVKNNVPYGIDDIEYKHNSDGFRCDEFSDWKFYKNRILFAFNK